MKHTRLILPPLIILAGSFSYPEIPTRILGLIGMISMGRVVESTSTHLVTRFYRIPCLVLIRPASPHIISHHHRSAHLRRRCFCSCREDGDRSRPLDLRTRVSICVHLSISSYRQTGSTTATSWGGWQGQGPGRSSSPYPWEGGNEQVSQVLAVLRAATSVEQVPGAADEAGASRDTVG